MKNTSIESIHKKEWQHQYDILKQIGRKDTVTTFSDSNYDWNE